MSPRPYRMKKKRASVEKTRRRIVEATLSLHGEKGIFGTSWADIARRADVAIGTVYRHFPTLDDLVPACGELLMERTQPPGPDDIVEILGDETDPAARLRRVAGALFGFYVRAGAFIESDLRERDLPAVREWEDYLRSTVEGFVRAAVDGTGAGDVAIGRVLFLFDVPTYRAMRTRGLSATEAEDTATLLAAAALGLAVPGTGSGSGRIDRAGDGRSPNWEAEDDRS